MLVPTPEVTKSVLLLSLYNPNIASRGAFDGTLSGPITGKLT
jgi:hypothetical protein